MKMDHEGKLVKTVKEGTFKIYELMMPMVHNLSEDFPAEDVFYRKIIAKANNIKFFIKWFIT